MCLRFYDLFRGRSYEYFIDKVLFHSGIQPTHREIGYVIVILQSAGTSHNMNVLRRRDLRCTQRPLT